MKRRPTIGLATAVAIPGSLLAGTATAAGPTRRTGRGQASRSRKGPSGPRTRMKLTFLAEVVATPEPVDVDEIGGAPSKTA